jgi:hypothetical protein
MWVSLKSIFFAFVEWRAFAYPLQTHFTATTKTPRLSLTSLHSYCASPCLVAIMDLLPHTHSIALVQ